VNNSAIIRDVGLTIANVLNLGLKAHKTKANVHIAPPQHAHFEKRVPAVGVSLLGFETTRFSGAGRPPEKVEQEQKPDGSISEFYVDPPLQMTLEYLVTAWAKEFEEEAALLGTAMKILLECPQFDKTNIVGDSFAPEDRLQLLAELNLSMERRMALFQAFGEPMRAASLYSVPVVLMSERRSPEIRRVITRHVGVVDNQTGRRLR